MHCLTVLLPFSAWVIKSLNFRKNTFDMVWLPVVVNDCNNMMVPRWFCIYYIIFSECCMYLIPIYDSNICYKHNSYGKWSFPVTPHVCPFVKRAGGYTHILLSEQLLLGYSNLWWTSRLSLNSKRIHTTYYISIYIHCTLDNRSFQNVDIFASNTFSISRYFIGNRWP